MGHRHVAALGAVLACALLPGVASAQVQPYGANDAGGFRNVLPAGAHGVDNLLQLGAFLTAGVKPEHFDDQQPLYDGLIRASPHLTHDQIADYYKDATFGVRQDDIASTESPRPGVTIVRDKSFGVPHVYGVSHGDVMFGAGWVCAEDRLFLMDVLRHTGRATLSSFIGGSASNRAMDRGQWALAPYTEADLQWQIDNAPKQYGVDGQGIIDDVTEYVDGINAYIDAAQLNPLLMPAEYATLGVVAPEKWTVRDIIAVASLIGGIFGRGGGGEVRSALALQALQTRFGKSAGKRAWSDFRQKDDPESPTTVRGRWPYENGSPFASRGLAIPDRGSVRFTPTNSSTPSAAARHATGWGASLGVQLEKALKSNVAHASNSLLIAARNSATGHPIAVMGPQVGYYDPQVLLEEDLHGPGVDARGAAFPAVSMYVELGHGRDYAWSATSADEDNIDTFAEVLCQDDFHYLYKGKCLQMDKLVRTNSWKPTLIDSTPAGSETLTAYRTVHGIVIARATVKGKKVAYVSARSTYFHEADSALGFKQFNDPTYLTSAKRFQKAASNINFVFNWLYTDSDDIAYYLSGWYPQRAKGTSGDFPVLGTGAYDWKGYKPSNHTLSPLPYSKHPNVVNPPYLVSWNNKQAKGFSSSDNNWAWGPVFRSTMLEDGMRRGIAHGRKMSLNELVSAMDEPATEDLRGLKLVPILARALGDVSKDPKLGPAVALLRRWSSTGAHRRDLDGDGKYDDDDAVTLMDAWWPKLVQAEFGSALGPDSMKAIQAMVGTGEHTDGGPTAPDFEGGWWGYVSKDLRDLFGPRPAKAARWSRVYCGRGRPTACRTVLRQSLRDALGVSRQALYGKGDCASNAQAACFDRNRYTVASGIDLPPFPFQNRPTFQQTVELTHRIPH
jgi:acyl-homoserine lactone acylase PvdQ